MARLPALVDDLAEHDRRGRATVEVIARAVREAGLITTTKRGRGAAEMTPNDAAALMIALCTAELPKDAPDAVRAFAGQVPVESDDFPQELELPPALALVVEAPDLQSAIATMIVEANGLYAIYRSMSVLPEDGGLGVRTVGRFAVEVTFSLPVLGASISADWEEGVEPRVVRRFVRSFERPHRFTGGPKPLRADRRIRVSVGLPTFMRLNRLLSRQ